MIKKTINFIRHDLWMIPSQELKPSHSIIIRQIRIIILAIKGIFKNNLQIRASALTLYTMLTVVPILAMIFGISKGFGLEEYLQGYLTENFSGQAVVIDKMIVFAQSLLSRTSGGYMAGIGVIILLYSVMSIFDHIETAFNIIWQVAKPRNFFRKFSDYFSLMFIAPVLIISSSSITVYITTYIGNLSEKAHIFSFLDKTVNFLLQFSPYLMLWLLFTLLYMIMPNTKVRFKSALYAGVIAGSIFQIVQWGYIHFQIGVSSYNAIYGSFAAIPLFIIWLQLSWLIVLLGAEMSFANQNIEKFEFESGSTSISIKQKRAVALYITHQIVKRFAVGEKSLTPKELAISLKLPVRLLREILSELVSCGIICEVLTDTKENNVYQPARDINQLTMYNVIDRLESYDDFDYKIKDENMDKIMEMQKELIKSMEIAKSNTLIKDI